MSDLDGGLWAPNESIQSLNIFDQKGQVVTSIDGNKFAALCNMIRHGGHSSGTQVTPNRQRTKSANPNKREPPGFYYQCTWSTDILGIAISLTKHWDSLSKLDSDDFVLAAPGWEVKFTHGAAHWEQYAQFELTILGARRGLFIDHVLVLEADRFLTDYAIIALTM